LRSRQSANTNKETSNRQKQNSIAEDNSKVPGLNKIPVNLFEENSQGEGLLKTGKLKPRPNLPIPFVPQTNAKGKPILVSPDVYTYFFVKFDSPNGTGVISLLKNFIVVKTLNPMTTVQFSQMSGYSISNVSSLSLPLYENDSFTHPRYTNSEGDPLSIRYAELPILVQKTPGRLDDVPIGYPDFDSTPDGVISQKGPQASAPYTNFTSATGLTSSVTITPGSSLGFKDTSPYLPFNIGPTGWSWNFGATASPTGSTAQNPTVIYGTTGTYSVTLTASNSTGSTTFTRTNFVIVTF
jgi:PKD repeat protein